MTKDTGTVKVQIVDPAQMLENRKLERAQSFLRSILIPDADTPYVRCIETPAPADEEKK